MGLLTFSINVTLDGARGDEEAPPAMREWAVKLEAKPKYVVSAHGRAEAQGRDPGRRAPR